jgi:hypothetical protein
MPLNSFTHVSVWRKPLALLVHLEFIFLPSKSLPCFTSIGTLARRQVAALQQSTRAL